VRGHPTTHGGRRESRPDRQQLLDGHGGVRGRGGQPLAFTLLAGAVELPLAEPGHDGGGDEDDRQQGQPAGLERRPEHASSVALRRSGARAGARLRAHPDRADPESAEEDSYSATVALMQICIRAMSTNV
jgi:hypothetical protein